jgi:hypothetical protein
MCHAAVAVLQEDGHNFVTKLAGLDYMSEEPFMLARNSLKFEHFLFTQCFKKAVEI